jgi:hypothetical protein
MTREDLVTMLRHAIAKDAHYAGDLGDVSIEDELCDAIADGRFPHPPTKLSESGER